MGVGLAAGRSDVVGDLTGVDGAGRRSDLELPRGPDLDGRVVGERNLDFLGFSRNWRRLRNHLESLRGHLTPIDCLTGCLSSGSNLTPLPPGCQVNVLTCFATSATA